MEHTMFARGDNIRSATLGELYLLHAMVNGYYVNVVVVLAKQVSRVANSPIEDIVIGGLVTPIVEHVGVPFCDDIDLPLVICSPCDMESLINMWMIYRDGESYGLVVHEKPMFYLPTKNKIRVNMEMNWLYTRETSLKRNQTMRVSQNLRLTMQVVTWMMTPMQKSSYLQETGTSTQYQDQSGLIHSEILYLKMEQQRQGDEQARQRVMVEDIHRSLYDLLLHFPPP